MMQPLSRRAWIERLFGGIGAAGVAGLLPERVQAATLGRYTGPRMPGKGLGHDRVRRLHARRSV